MLLLGELLSVASSLLCTMFKLGTGLFLVSESSWLTLGHLFILGELKSPLTSPERCSEAQGLNAGNQ